MPIYYFILFVLLIYCILILFCNNSSSPILNNSPGSLPGYIQDYHSNFTGVGNIEMIIDRFYSLYFIIDYQ